MSEIIFNDGIDLFGFNLGNDKTSYPNNPNSTASVDDATEGSVVYSFVNDTLCDGNNLYGRYMSRALETARYVVYRQNINDKIKLYVGTIDDVHDGFWDYNIASNEKYKYIVETDPLDNEDKSLTSEFSYTTVSLETDSYINPCWRYWSICDIEKDLNASSNSQRDIYVPGDTVFLIKNNVSAGNIQDNINVIQYNTLGTYGKVILNKLKYDSGDISCLIGDFLAILNIKSNKNIVVVNNIKTQQALNDYITSEEITKIDDYENKYFKFPEYSSKYYEIVKTVLYLVLDSEPDNWTGSYTLYYTIQNNEYVKAESKMRLVESLFIEDGEIPLNILEFGPEDFKDNYALYYKIEECNGTITYTQLSTPCEWATDTYYILSWPEYNDTIYYRQIIDCGFQEVKKQENVMLTGPVELLNAWRECVSNGKMKLLRAPNGLKWIVSINGSNNISVDWNSGLYPTTISFNWQEVLDKNKISIIKW